MDPTIIAAALQAALQAILAMLQSTKLDSAAIDRVLAFLIGIVPYLGQLGSALVAPVENVIAALKAQPAATADQLSALDRLNATVDAAWNDAVAKYLANHPGA
jgi:hypothetical protein